MTDKSKCPSCSNTQFEAVNETPANSDYKLTLVRCTSCKAVVGITDLCNIGELVKKLAIKLEVDLEK